MKDIYSEQLNEPVTAVKVQVSVMPVQVIQALSIEEMPLQPLDDFPGKK